MVDSFYDEELFNERYLVFRCDRNAVSSSKKAGCGDLIGVRRDFDVTGAGPQTGFLCLVISICQKSDGVYDGVGLMPTVNVTTDLESDLIEGLLSCDLGQIIAISNRYGMFLDSAFSNAGVDVAMWTCESRLLKLDRHHRAYELSVDLQFCDCEAIIKELGSIDWYSLVRVWISVLTCFMMLYGSVLVGFVPKTSSHCVQKFSWVTKELNGLKNSATIAAKKMK
jgi:hypothetical protein